ncbi:ras GTPase-activating protein-binding protein 1 [Zeugodacus cucurbitae]|uniref:ras GTPase-activating protein-binding protein 1 n=1 Tax=Zeugodacus cucurbitae TaxID=28588 RepID=UPI0005967A3D|nr:ras GTPase-activating protein-binding protein 1 [Zeugodacus cucurbitae]XP_054081216.1 ras GTPase-activating protein-binding protein 1 [Zeugodacus cucurbitae]
MVMDATQSQQPSPQSVGREFVRQYYTLLNRAPSHLHRFYNNNSSFIHGESTLVVGQRNIYNRIQQLNFNDCHAKISQVDAQATLGNGVVVQVTGELSNDGQPMRRFTQTFVLASQSPKKYYVHNDIFRYQDVFSDEENEGETRTEQDEEHVELQQSTATTSGALGNEQVGSNLVAGSGPVTAEQQQQPQQLTQLSTQAVNATAGSGVLPQQQTGAQPAVGGPQQPAIYYSVPAAGGRPVPLLTGAAPQATSAVSFSAAAPAAVVSQQVQLNGVVGHEDLLSTGNPQQQQGQGQQQQIVAPSTSPVVQQSTNIAVATPVLPGQTGASAGVTAVPVAVPANANIPGFQQSPLLQSHVLQQQQPLQQPLVQQTQITQQSSVVDLEEGVISPSLTSNAESVPRSGSASLLAAADNAPAVDDFKTINEQQQQEKYEAAKQQQQQQNEIKTYANLFKSSSSSPSGFVTAAMQQQQQLQQQQQQTSNNAYHSATTISSTTYSQSNSNSTSSLSVYNNRNSESSSLRLDNNNTMSSVTQGGPLPQRNNASRINKEYEPRRTSNAQQSDNQQLFLGNIPHHASEEELKALFGRFGQVLELRVMSKANGKLPPGVRNPQNFGFITYEDPESVQNCLANCPLYFPENSPDGQKLNVEEKKPRPMRPNNDMPSRQSMGGNSMGGNMNNSQRNMSGGPPSRSLSNSAGGGASGGMMRNAGGSSANSNSMSRGQSSGGGPRLSGGFNRNENRSGPTNGNGPQVRGSNQNSAQSSGASGGNSYGTRR